MSNLPTHLQQDMKIAVLNSGTLKTILRSLKRTLVKVKKSVKKFGNVA